MEVTSSVTTLAAKENNNYAENDWTRFNEPLLQMIRLWVEDGELGD
jgi:hypothetical protein